MSSTINSTLRIMQNIARKAGYGLLRDFGEVEHLQVSRKGPADFVSTADKKTEEFIVKSLQNDRPEYSFLCEETGEIKGSMPEHRFIIDPIDGTTNFIHGIPHWAISIAYQIKGETVAAVTHDPIKNETFSAEKGAGASLNGNKLRVSGRNRLVNSIVSVPMPFAGFNQNKNGQIFSALSDLSSKVCGIRETGSAALDLAYVAAGRYDGYAEYGLYPWDIAGGILMVTEAGGFVVDETMRPHKFDGDGAQDRWCIASNDGVQDAFFSAIAKS